MKRFLLYLVAWLVAWLPLQAHVVVINDSVQTTVEQIVATGLPLVLVETVDAVEPTCDYVSAPPGAWGMSITNATKVPGRLCIYRGDTIPAYDSGEYDGRSHGMTIKLRGNTSAYRDKKPYKIKLETSDDLLMRDDPDCYERDWLLVTDDQLKALSGFMLGQVLGMQWTPAFRYVNLVINDNYRGVYMLIESIKRNPYSRIDVSRSGMLCEADAYWWNADVYIKSSLDAHYGYTFKYPSDEGLSEADLNYFRDYLGAFEASLSQDNYEQYIDVTSFARWCLAQDILGAWDSGGTNRYYSRYDREQDTPLVMPCLWDFDSNEMNYSNWSRCHVEHFSRLFNNPNQTFRLEYIKQWFRVLPTLRQQMKQLFTDFRYSNQYRGMYNSVLMNNHRWGTTISFMLAVSNRDKWYDNRLPILQKLIDSLRLSCDVNIDGSVDVADVNTAINCMLGQNAPDVIPAACDVNQDDAVDVTDVNFIINAMLGR